MATVKTALSIDEELFEQAEALAREFNVSRSRIFAMALEQFLKQYKGAKLLEQINSVYGEQIPADEKEASVRRRKHRELVKGSW